MTADWRIVEFAGRTGLDQLEGDWDRLVAAMPDAGFHHAFATHRAYLDRLASPLGSLTCIALSDGERIRAICPLEPIPATILGRRTRAWGLPLGLGDVHRDVICPPDPEVEREFLPRVVAHLRESPTGIAWLVLDRLMDGSAAARCLAALPGRRSCTRLVAEVAVVDCRRSIDDLRSSLSRNFRGNLRKARNKLAALADVRFESVSDPAGLASALETFLALEASGWKGEDGTRTAMRFRPRPLAFYHELLANAASGGLCEINSLHVGDRCVASQLCARAGGEYTVLKIAYDERSARLAPGQLLFERTVERCCADAGIRRVNLVTHQEWHDDWTPEVIPIRSAYVSLGDAPGLLLVALLRLRFRVGPRVRSWLSGSGRGARVRRWLAREGRLPGRATSPEPRP